MGQIGEKNNGQDKYSISFVAAANATSLSHGNLYLLGDPITAVMLRTVMKDILYYGVRNFFVFAINCSLAYQYEGIFTSVTES